MKISVIIPTLNAASHLPEMLPRLQRQSRVPHEIIVIDSTSDDKTVQIATLHGVKVLEVERRSFNHGGTRNYAATHATGDVLVFMTQDAMPADENFLEQLTRSLEDPEVVAAYGRQIANPNASLLERITREFNYPPISIRKSMANIKMLGIKTFFYSNVCSAIRRDVFQRMGGFDHPMISNEDMILAAKCILAGNSIVYAAEARVIHSHEFTIRQLFRRYFDIGVSIRINSWLLQYAKPEGEGGRLLKVQLRQLIQQRKWHRIPLWGMESFAKYAGYRLGFNYRKLPKATRIFFSLHKNFWNHIEEKKVVIFQDLRTEKSLSDKNIIS
jgi:rhamnosyltransferase